MAAHAAATIDRSGPALVVEQRDTQAPLVGTVVVLVAGTDRQTLAQNGLAALTAETIVRTPAAIGGGAPKPLEDTIAAHGGSLRFTIANDGVEFYVESLPEDAAATLAAFRAAISHPDTSGAVVNDARTHLVARVKAADKNPYELGVAMLDAAAEHGSYGTTPLGNAATLAARLPADVRSFYESFYVSHGAVVSAVGRTDVLPADTLRTLLARLPQRETAPAKNVVPELSGASRSLVARRDIAAPWLLARYNAPSISSKDFGAMLVLTAFVQHTLADIAEVPGVVTPTAVSRSIGAVYGYDARGGTLTVYVNGSMGSPNRAFATALSLVNILSGTKMQGNIDQFKASAYGDFVTGAASLESRATLAALFAQSGASSDFLSSAMQAIQSTQTADLQRVAKAYLSQPVIALVLPRSTAAQP